MSFFFTIATQKIADGTIVIGLGHKLKVAALLDTSECETSASTAQDRANVAAISSLAEVSATGYGRQAIHATLTPTVDNATNSTTWVPGGTNAWTITSGSSTLGGFLIYYDADNDIDPSEDASNIPVAYINGSGITGTLFSGTITVTWTSLLKAIAQ